MESIHMTWHAKVSVIYILTWKKASSGTELCQVACSIHGSGLSSSNFFYFSPKMASGSLGKSSVNGPCQHHFGSSSKVLELLIEGASLSLSPRHWWYGLSRVIHNVTVTKTEFKVFFGILEFMDCFVLAFIWSLVFCKFALHLRTFRKPLTAQVTFNPNVTLCRVTLFSLDNPFQGEGTIQSQLYWRRVAGNAQVKEENTWGSISLSCWFQSCLAKIAVLLHSSFPKVTFNLIFPLTVRVNIALVIEAPVQKSVWPLVYSCQI